MYRSAAGSHSGKVRVCNQDAFFDCPEQAVWAVADGMGGHQAGELASRLIVDTLAGLCWPGELEQRLELLRCRLHGLNRHLALQLTQSQGQAPRVMGSTLVTLLLQGQQGACVWVGDSRCYLWRGQQLYQLTRDHAAERGRAALTRALGGREHLQLEVLRWHAQPGDRYLLCSDGLYRMLDQARLGQALGLATPQAALHGLFAQVLQGPAPDNLTAVVVDR
ncbi:serine/threonine-protein phosphatase [Pseudomonas sp. 21LCFQ02]|uniref:PP2C family protein-serine/threonine phosphatase n=1 Tax=Pseudomonas sp. 21LCFQ02 TaxID=2957505 RepID=UPI00209AC3AD|nr:PP2C family serine/threonine-protein phosphatase [Pseudomonas sp. 21LCFQ02]MCO8170761.1 serine/threonine-protein phosphatase [Pseudomonas sp. 21LCFQ02]